MLFLHLSAEFGLLLVPDLDKGFMILNKRLLGLVELLTVLLQDLAGFVDLTVHVFLLLSQLLMLLLEFLRLFNCHLLGSDLLR